MEGITNFLKKYSRSDLKVCYTAEEAYAEIERIYTKGLETLKASLKALQTIDENLYPTYPFVGLYVPENHLTTDCSPSFGVVQESGIYGTTVTHVKLFKKYLTEQLDSLIQNHRIPILVGESFEPIPLTYAIRDIEDLGNLKLFPHNFILPDLKRINDNIANGIAIEGNEDLKPLSLFKAERMDFSIHRLEHYTSTCVDHFQNFVIFINYQRYTDAFMRHGLEKMKEDPEYFEFIGPDNKVIDEDYIKNQPKVHAQMPAYHLKRKDHNGITFINIGVGPSNAKNITDHLATLRPHCWIMLGHCAGLRHNQFLGDYVLAHAYIREDHILDNELPSWVPIPNLAEIQQAIEQGIENVCHPNNIKRCLRIGSILTTSDRNWELNSFEVYKRFKKTRAIAVDMESATIAANGFRLRVPYGSLLCVSDKPIHGEVKLKSMADDFYNKRVQQHLEVGLETVEVLRKRGIEQLHSRKLRGYDDPPFR